MILDQIVRGANYGGLCPLFVEAFNYLKFLPLVTPLGRYNIKRDDLYVLIQDYKSVPAPERSYESHRRYIDIHCVLEGEEVMYYAPLDSLTIQQPYDQDNDVTLYAHDDHPCPVRVKAGSFAIFFPQEGHKPGCSGERSGQVRKAVFKVRIV